MTRESIYLIIFHLCHLMICTISCGNQALFHVSTFSEFNSDDEAFCSDLYPIIPANLMSVKEILNMDNFSHHRTW